MEYTNEQISNAAKYCLENEDCRGCPLKDLPYVQDCLKVFAKTISENTECEVE